MKLNEKTVNLIKKQINIEFTNAAIYTELANWCEYEGYKASAQLYRSQANGEIGHRDKFIKFLLDLGYETPMIMTNDHKTTVTNLEQTFQLSLMLEERTTKELLMIKKAAEDSEDYVSSSLLNWYLDEQVEEESIFIDLLDACKNIGLANKSTPEWAKGQMRQMIDNRIAESQD